MTSAALPAAGPIELMVDIVVFPSNTSITGKALTVHARLFISNMQLTGTPRWFLMLVSCVQ
jgi:hypothetical protein